MKRTESNIITKYETDLWNEVNDFVKEVDKNESDLKITYTSKSGKYDVVVRQNTKED